MKPRLKICGITRTEDALLAVSLGVHALGFIFYKKSPRYISPERAREIIIEIPPFVQTVGVFVNESREKIREIASFCGLNLIQLHGDESPLFCEKLGLACIKAFRIKDEHSIENMVAYKGKVRGFLVDTYKKDQPGGTGESFNWELAIKAKVYNVPIILAGGLAPDNIKRAVDTVQPYALDVNSGIEKTPGIKDKKLMEKLFAVWSKI
ncbi:N-(5'-phosphoribosyl)anthranilate isomerase [Candidatus Desulfofervidus auxilii]|uniref:N-(5'-phosphoribosyl)anthranilate isomerase n=1 Tax=Desulfofervidus auxilii TaxID=1621989 RepID=A0A7U4QL75_DESA2|nr:phosphoribosylanthranilate isomerase [Candidatus Desulfofervidus auxilii]AMM41393.1 N-(5'-phosphoribosyl)anthranilate isomerase [Candidatus Desulfofervidus auxilii]